jgi:hypothetical protein
MAAGRVMVNGLGLRTVHCVAISTSPEKTGFEKEEIMQFVSFHKIPQFADTVRGVLQRARFAGLDENGEPIYNQNAEIPVVTFTGTTKLHGTNSSVCMSGNEMWAQSRSRIITPESDNYNFAQFAMKREASFRKLLLEIQERFGKEGTVSLFGEYCGEGIQNGVGISQLPKMFVVFAVKLVNDDITTYLRPAGLRDEENQIYNVRDFETFQVDVDFAYPGFAQNEFVSLVDKVEQCCPVAAGIAKKLGVELTNTTGEGIVWSGWYKDLFYTFKTKGEKHSATKVKKVASVDLEKIASIKDFVEYAVTENRLQQGMAELFGSQNKVPSTKDTGDFLRWVMKDIASEEMETLLKKDLVLKDVGKAVSNAARPWFFEQINQTLNL